MESLSNISSSRRHRQGASRPQELWVKGARQVPTLGSIHQCLSLVQQNYHSRGYDESMCFAALTTALPSSGAANYTARGERRVELHVRHIKPLSLH
jgi:hypothetical protein